MSTVAPETSRDQGLTTLIGVDVGGTHTDIAVSTPTGLVRGKALTSHDEYSRGILEAIAVAGERLDLSLAETLGQTEQIVLSTTVVTNALTELRGAKVGVLITQGFKDTFRLAGGARQPVMDDQAHRNPPDLVPRSCIVEIPERVLSDGTAAVALDEDAVRMAVRQLRDEGVDAIAVCFLWSFKVPGHEQRAREIIEDEWPEVFTSLSSEVYPVIREHERFFSAVFNCFCQPAASILLDTLRDRLDSEGFAGELTMFSGAGGVIPVETARRLPVLLLASGPAGGVAGAIHLAERMGHENIIVTDMGGTSYDLSLVEDRRAAITPRISVAGLDTGISIVDVLSVGAGGGSIVWIDERGVPQVGPHSAGSMPGPACYGRGGERPTVTDAAVVAGLIDPAGYLNGRMSLDREAAVRVVGAFGAKLGWTPNQAANAILDLTVTNMANATRSVSVERGYDPREFAMFAYGGTLPLFAPRICDALDITRVVLPANSSVFCAFGLLTADFVRRYSTSVDVTLGADVDPTAINEIRRGLVEQARTELAQVGLDPDRAELEWEAGVRFAGQVWEITVPLADEDLTTASMTAMAAGFPATYERSYGEGTAWEGSEVLLANLTLRTRVPRRNPTLATPPPGDPDVEAALKGRRRALLPGADEQTEIPVYDGNRFAEGLTVSGPAIVDEHDTTLFIPPSWSCTRDHMSNYNLKKEG
ncbi:N-methylhydantoinase A [Patulibacter medicamentivorans]|uniref:N-methylhydantoinase A n=1 Tax=Patulibacter medicamentivorans TaxID=1097667 RepID=H0E014_9ACTN|nr:hydantoinase/oxoprolinase family protein [Patulibacter medicamentivorans]EHN12973.1 N-methylhydantoinase A [Patulibacter medicamentivorans]